jgi:hypothetical protein
VSQPALAGLIVADAEKAHPLPSVTGDPYAMLAVPLRPIALTSGRSPAVSDLSAEYSERPCAVTRWELATRINYLGRSVIEDQHTLRSLPNPWRSSPISRQKRLPAKMEPPRVET